MNKKIVKFLWKLDILRYGGRLQEETLYHLNFCKSLEWVGIIALWIYVHFIVPFWDFPWTPAPGMLWSILGMITMLIDFIFAIWFMGVLLLKVNDLIRVGDIIDYFTILCNNIGKKITIKVKNGNK